MMLLPPLKIGRDGDLTKYYKRWEYISYSSYMKGLIMIPYLTSEVDKQLKGWVKCITKEGILVYTKKWGERKIQIVYTPNIKPGYVWEGFYFESGIAFYACSAVDPKVVRNILLQLIFMVGGPCK